MRANKKATVPNPSVGAEGEQSQVKTDNEIVAGLWEESNAFDEESAESSDSMLEEMERMSDPAYLLTVSMNELYERVYKGRPPIIDGLLYAGTYLFVGAPKVGKSFLMAQLAYHVSTGQPFWGYPVRQGTVLYLALEDDYRRLQERMFRMFGVESTPNLHFAIDAKQIGTGLYDQLRKFVKEHANTKLVIIDTLQKVREAGSEKYSYASDYEIVGQLKRFAQGLGLCLLLVHHTRKQQADDAFDMISGTNGLLGAADGAFMLQKEKRTEGKATLEIAGRDQPEQKLYLLKDHQRLTWELERAEAELWKAPPDPILEMVVRLMADRSEWNGSPTELAESLEVEMKPNALTRHLNVKASELKTEHGILYDNKPLHRGRRISLTKMAAGG